MINVISCSMLRSPSTSDCDEIDSCFSKSTVLEATIETPNKRYKPCW